MVIQPVAELLHGVLQSEEWDGAVELPTEFGEFTSRRVEERCRLSWGRFGGGANQVVLRLRRGGLRSIGISGLRQLAVLSAKLLEFRGDRLGPVPPPFKVICDKPCLTIRAQCIGGVYPSQSRRIR